MIKVALLEDAARLAAQRRRALTDLAHFSRRQKGEYVTLSVDRGYRTVRGDLADELVDLVIADLKTFLADASAALTEAGVDISEEDRPTKDVMLESDSDAATPELHTSRGKPRCVAIKPGGHQCCNGALEVGGVCTIHYRAHLRHASEGDESIAEVTQLDQADKIRGGPDSPA